jgi:hypothetical protein
MFRIRLALLFALVVSAVLFIAPATGAAASRSSARSAV